MPIDLPRPRPLEPIEDDHSASRRLDVLELEAPHLIAEPTRTARSVRELATMLRATVASMRRLHAADSTIIEELWELADRTAGELAERLGELEREERRR
jgi:hypothetical protein